MNCAVTISIHRTAMLGRSIALVFAVLAMVCGARTGASAAPQGEVPAAFEGRLRSMMPALEHHRSMAAAAETIALRSGLSVLIEGWPPQAAYPGMSNRGAVTVDGALTDLARAYDYGWSILPSGVVLFRKLFSDENSRPEFHEAELLSVAGDLLDAAGRVDSRADGVTAPLRLLQAMVASLSPGQERQASGEGLPVLALAPEARAQVVQAIRGQVLGPLSYHWSRLEAQLRELKSGAVTEVPPRRVGGTVLPTVALVFPEPASEHTSYPAVLWPAALKPGPDPAPEPAPAVSGIQHSESPLVRADTVEAAARELSRQPSMKIVVAPELLEKRLVMLVQPQDIAQAAAALAELHGWSYTIRKGEDHAADGVGTIRRRVRLRTSNPTSESASALLELLPADVARCLTTPPHSLNGRPLTYIRDAIPIPGPNGQEMDRLRNKLTIQARQAREELRQSLVGRDLTRGMPYSALSAEQRRSLVYALFADAAAESVETFMRVRHGLPGYAQDPLNARIIRRGEAYGVQGARGGLFMMRQVM